MKSKISLLIFLITIALTLFSQETDPEEIIISAEYEDYQSTESKTVIDTYEIESFPGASTPEIIANVMGVKLSRFGNDSQPSYISIRGSSPEQVLVLINGKRQNSSQGGGVDLSTIPPEQIKQIEIIRGGNSAVYGNSAFGGVINIKLKEATEDSANIKYDLDSDIRNELSGCFYTSNNVLSLGSNINILYSPGGYLFNSRTGEEERENSDITSLTVGTDLQKVLKNLKIKWSENFYMADKGAPGLLEFPTSEARLKDITLNSDLKFYNPNLNFGINYLYKQREYRNRQSIYDNTESNQNYSSISSILEYNNPLFLVELSGNYDYLISDSFNTNYLDRVNISLFTSPNLKYDKLKITPSARVNYNLENEILFNWSIEGLYSLNKINLDVKSSVGTAYRKPSFNDLFWPESTYAVGNQNLNNEKAFISDISLAYSFANNYTLETTMYYHLVENLIQWSPSANGVWSPKNIGKAEIKGLESELSYFVETLPILGYLEGRLNYTYLSALNKEDGILYNKILIYRATHKANLTLVYYSDLNFIYSIDLRYTGERYITSGNTKSNPAYFLLDMNFIKEIYSDFILTIYGKNILNIKYQDYRGYPVPGLTIGVSIEYEI